MKHKSKTAYGLLGRAVIVVAWCLLLATIAWAAEEGARRRLSAVEIMLLPKFWIGAISCVIGLILLVKSRVGRSLRLAWLAVAFFVFGVLGALPLGSFASGMGLHPSPVCAITRPFQFVNAGRSIPILFFIVLGFITVFSLAGNKLFCGWVCPLGAVQEMTHRIKLSKKKKKAMKFKKMLPFRVTNTIRVLIFIAFIPVVFIVGDSIYDYFNPFEFFHWKFGTVAVAAMAVTLIVSVFMFRPFCYLACPIGLLTWLLEHISITRIRFNKEECTECDVCIKETNCPAVGPIMAEKNSRPDCHACGQCIEACPTDALEFR